MRLLVILLTLAFSSAILSGCIDASGWEEHTDDWSHDQEASVEEDCPDDAYDDHDASGEAHAHDAHEEVEPEDAFADADPRYHNEVDGSEDSERTIRVPLGADRLRVALVHDSDGSIDFTLYDPLYRTQAAEDTSGTKYMLEDDWAVIEDPLPGDWHLDIDITGHSHYTVGFYLDD